MHQAGGSASGLRWFYGKMRVSMERCRGAACRSRRCTGAINKLPLKWQILPICHCEEAGGRRGNLAETSWTTGRPRRIRSLVREIATAPSGPRNDKSGGIAPLNLFRNHCQPAWRSLTAAADAIGLYVFIVSLFLALVRSRARLSAPLHFPLRCRKIPPGRVFIPAGM